MAKSSSSKWAFGAIFTGVAGFLAGILMAPKSGKDTRKDIKDAAIQAKTEAEKKLKSVHSELNKTLNDVKTHGDKLSGKAKTEFDGVLVHANAAKEKVRETLSSLHDGDAEDPDLKKALQDAQDALKNLAKFVKKTK
jgi:gas vesicle protein